jgi:hypothetical protein
MKKIHFKTFLFLLGLILVTFSSCRKCYYCSCNTFGVEVCNEEDRQAYQEMGCDCDPY